MLIEKDEIKKKSKENPLSRIFQICVEMTLCVYRNHPPVKSKLNSFRDKTKIYLWKSATSFTSAMTILCSIIMCFKSLSCSATGKCSSQKIQGTDGGPDKAVGPPGLSGRDSGSRMQSSLSGRGQEKKEETETNPAL